MKTFMRLALSFFALAILIFVFAYLFNPGVRSNILSDEQPVGQLPSTLDIQSSGQPESLNDSEVIGTEQGTSRPADGVDSAD